MTNTTENKKEKVKEQKSFLERVKHSDAKKVSRIVIIFFFLFTIIFGTITNIGFKQFDFVSWLADMLILIGIMVFGLIMGEQNGLDRYKERANGLYQRNLALYNETMAKNSHLMNGLNQWYSWKLPEELFEKKRRFLVSRGVPYDNATLILSYCRLEDADKLPHQVLKKIDKNTKHEIYIDQIEEYQLDAVKYALGSEFKLDAPDGSYFLTAGSNKYGDLSIFEVGNAIQKDIKRTRNLTRAMKIGSSTVISAFMAALTVGEMMQGDSLQAWMKLISRITALLTSMFSGNLSAKEMVKMEAQMIKNKVIVIGMYVVDIMDKNFKLKNREEIAKEKWEKHEQELEEAKKNVVYPDEVINGDGSIKRLKNESAQIEYKK